MSPELLTVKVTLVKVAKAVKEFVLPTDPKYNQPPGDGMVSAEMMADWVAHCDTEVKDQKSRA